MTNLEAERVQTLIGVESSQGCLLGTHVLDLFWQKPGAMGRGTYRWGYLRLRAQQTGGQGHTSPWPLVLWSAQ